MQEEINGTYGSQATPCTIFTYGDGSGYVWYCVEDSYNVNQTLEENLFEGVDVETVEDVDMFTASQEIASTEELAREVEGDVETIFTSIINGQRTQAREQFMDGSVTVEELLLVWQEQYQDDVTLSDVARVIEG